MTASKQWIAVGAIIAGLGLGAWALTRVSSGVTRVEIGSPVPSVRVPNLATGDTVTLPREYRGHVTLVNIWATWCVPCRVEMPAMQRAYAALGDSGFRIAAVSIDEGSPDGVKKFVREFGLTFDIYQDRTGTIQQLYQTAGVPESFLLDRHGVLVKRVIGSQDWASPVNEQLIRSLLTGAGS